MTAETKSEIINTATFADLGLPELILNAVESLGYTTPTPIQQQAIPYLMAGSDVLGQAQTGTGKTAAFALPLLAQVQIKRREPQILVLVPTRELALQVAKAFDDFAVTTPGINILPIYGGQGYNTQLSALRKGAHIIIGTPGRVMDHMRRGTLKLDSLKTLILDEADEMLRMGFAEDVEWILQEVPEERQIGLFSATMPPAIKSIAETYLNNPQRITIKTKTSTAATIKQLYSVVGHTQKLNTLARIIETEDSDALIVFVKTKRATEELAEQLNELGFNAVAINGDIVQQQRERVIEQLKAGKIKLLIATDVAARGIDVDRITHVINYDAPNNTESYVHRIGRTGRAGRTGTAIIFITPREKYILRNIEQATKQPIAELATPSISKVNERRIASFKQRITDAAKQNTSFFEKLIADYMEETETPAVKVAAILARMLQGDKPLVLKNEIEQAPSKSYSRDSNFERSPRSDRGERAPRGRGSDRGSSFRGQERQERSTTNHSRFSNSREGSREAGMDQYRVDIGRDDGLLPKNLVGAIANTTGIEGRSIGKIKIESKFSLVDLPKNMPRNMLQSLARLKLSGKQMNLKKVTS